MSRHSRLQPALALAAVAVVLLPSAGQEARAKPGKYAVLVGVNRYEHADLKTLKYAENDVVALGKLLGKNGYEVVLLTGAEGVTNAKRKPTRANIEAAIKEVLRKCRRGDTVLLAFAGHGLQFEGRDDAFFCPADARPFKDEIDTLVSLAKVYAELKKSFAGVKLLFVDACRDDPKAARGSRGVDGDHAPRPPSGVGALFSCSAGQRAYEDDALKHGVFFHYVLEGLKGKAKDPEDGDVTFEGLATYVKKQVTRDVPKRIGGGARQAPTLNAGELSGEPAVLLTVRTAASASPSKVFEKDYGATKVDKDARAVLDRAIKALGGEEKLAKVKAVSWKAKGKFTVGSVVMPVTMHITHQDIDKYRTEIELEVSGIKQQTMIVRNGDNGWTKANGVVTKMDKGTLAKDANNATQSPFLLANLVATCKGSTIETAGEETVHGKPATDLKVTRPDGKVVRLFFDKETGLPVKQVTKVAGEMGKEATMEMTYSRYKDYGEVKHPSKIEVRQDDNALMELEVTEYKLLKTVDPKTFAEPK